MSAMGQPHPSSSTASAALNGDAKEEARQRALELARKRREIDGQIAKHADVLKREQVTLSSSLLDSEGFPIATIDIPAVREARSKIIALQNDRKDIDSQLNQLLEVALAR